MKKLSDVEIYLSRLDTDYLYLFRSAVIAYCAREYRIPIKKRFKLLFEVSYLIMLIKTLKKGK